MRPPHLNPYRSRFKLSARVCFLHRLQAASVPSGSVKESGPESLPAIFFHVVFRTFTFKGGDEESFLAVDGCREQVILNLLVFLEGTLNLSPCHEFMDLSGDLPKFLKIQKTN